MNVIGPFPWASVPSGWPYQITANGNDWWWGDDNGNVWASTFTDPDTHVLLNDEGQYYDGICWDPVGNRLLVSDWNFGVYEVDTSSGARTLLIDRSNGEQTGGLTVSATTGDIYFTTWGSDGNLYRYSPTGTLVDIYDGSVVPGNGSTTMGPCFYDGAILVGSYEDNGYLLGFIEATETWLTLADLTGTGIDYPETVTVLEGRAYFTDYDRLAEVELATGALKLIGGQGEAGGGPAILGHLGKLYLWSASYESEGYYYRTPDSVLPAIGQSGEGTAVKPPGNIMPTIGQEASGTHATHKRPISSTKEVMVDGSTAGGAYGVAILDGYLYFTVSGGDIYKAPLDDTANYSLLVDVTESESIATLVVFDGELYSVGWTRGVRRVDTTSGGETVCTTLQGQTLLRHEGTGDWIYLRGPYFSHLNGTTFAEEGFRYYPVEFDDPNDVNVYAGIWKRDDPDVLVLFTNNGQILEHNYVANTWELAGDAFTDELYATYSVVTDGRWIFNGLYDRTYTWPDYGSSSQEPGSTYYTAWQQVVHDGYLWSANPGWGTPYGVYRRKILSPPGFFPQLEQAGEGTFYAPIQELPAIGQAAEGYTLPPRPLVGAGELMVDVGNLGDGNGITGLAVADNHVYFTVYSGAGQISHLYRAPVADPASYTLLNDGLRSGLLTYLNGWLINGGPSGLYTYDLVTGVATQRNPHNLTGVYLWDPELSRYILPGYYTYLFNSDLVYTGYEAVNEWITGAHWDPINPETLIFSKHNQTGIYAVDHANTAGPQTQVGSWRGTTGPQTPTQGNGVNFVLGAPDTWAWDGVNVYMDEQILADGPLVGVQAADWGEHLWVASGSTITRYPYTPAPTQAATFPSITQAAEGTTAPPPASELPAFEQAAVGEVVTPPLRFGHPELISTFTDLVPDDGDTYGYIPAFTVGGDDTIWFVVTDWQDGDGSTKLYQAPIDDADNYTLLADIPGPTVDSWKQLIYEEETDTLYFLQQISSSKTFKIETVDQDTGALSTVFHVSIDHHQNDAAVSALHHLATDEWLIFANATLNRVYRYEGDGTYIGHLTLPVRTASATWVTPDIFATAGGSNGNTFIRYNYATQTVVTNRPLGLSVGANGYPVAYSNGVWIGGWGYSVQTNGELPAHEYNREDWEEAATGYTGVWTTDLAYVDWKGSLYVAVIWDNDFMEPYTEHRWIWRVPYRLREQDPASLPFIDQYANGYTIPWTGTGEAASTLPIVGQNGDGWYDYIHYLNGNSQLPLPGPQSGTGTYELPDHYGPAASTLPSLGQSAAGVVHYDRTGTADQTLPAVTQSAQGSFARAWPMPGIDDSQSGADCAPFGDTDIKYTPVTVESVSMLSGCVMPNGQGLLLWKNGATVRFTVMNSPSAWLADDVVALEDITTALDVGAGQIMSCACFSDGVDLYFSAMYKTTTAGTGYQRIYKANNPADPVAGWSLYSTIQAFGLNSKSLVDSGMIQAGIPYMVGDTWVYTGGKWANTISNYHLAVCGLWTSTDHGLTWTNRLSVGFYWLNSYQDYIPPQLTPSGDGHLYVSFYGHPLDVQNTYRAPFSDLTSWSLVRSEQYSQQFTNWGVVGNSGYTDYSFSIPTSQVVEIEGWDQSDPRGQAFSDHLEVGIHHRIGKVGSCKWHLFDVDTVQWLSVRDYWLVGSVGFPDSTT